MKYIKMYILCNDIDFHLSLEAMEYTQCMVSLNLSWFAAPAVTVYSHPGKEELVRVLAHFSASFLSRVFRSCFEASL